MQVPIGVWLPSAPQFLIDADGKPLTGAFKRCTPVACFADVSFTSAHVASIRALGDADAQGSVVFQMTEGQNATIPISFNGFIPAFNAMKARSGK